MERLFLSSWRGNVLREGFKPKMPRADVGVEGARLAGLIALDAG